MAARSGDAASRGACSLGIAVLTAALGLGAVATPASAQFERSKLRVTKDLAVEVLHGYPRSRHNHYSPVTIGLSIRNRGPERTLEIEVDGDTRHTRTLRLSAEDKQRTFLYLPSSIGDAQRLDLRLTDGLSGKRKSFIAVSHTQTKEPIARLGHVSAAFNVAHPFGMVGDVGGHIPDSWRGLVGLRAIAVEQARYDGLSAADRKVLLEWTAAGGLLLIVQPDEVSAAAVALSAPLLGSPQSVPDGQQQRLGHGAVVHLPAGNLAEVDTSFWTDIGTCESCGWTVPVEATWGEPFGYLLDERIGNPGGKPTFGLFIVLLLFALAVGPVGWRFLVVGKRRPLYYVSFVMVSALVFSGGVLVADVFAQGLTPKGVAHSLRVIDQVNDLEIGTEELAIYAPTARGTRLDMAAAHMPVLPRQMGDGERGALHVDSGDGRQSIEGAIDVRFRRLVGARWIGKSEGRLVVSTEGGIPSVENHLGADLRSLVVWHEGRAHGIEGSLGQGQRATLEPLSEDDAGQPHLPTGFLIAQSSELVQALASGELGGQRYYGLLERDPGDSRLIDARMNETTPGVHLVAGIYR
ncbi:MAG: hypothetical protein OXT09_23755 [Myxococcales bacterium]|nr:hypothetical protein [Myxococcales bacterium]